MFTKKFAFSRSVMFCWGVRGCAVEVSSNRENCFEYFEKLLTKMLWKFQQEAMVFIRFSVYGKCSGLKIDRIHRLDT